MGRYELTAETRRGSTGRRQPTKGESAISLLQGPQLALIEIAQSWMPGSATDMVLQLDEKGLYGDGTGSHVRHLV